MSDRRKNDEDNADDDDDEDKNADDKKDKKQGFRQRLRSIRKSKRKKEVVQKEVSTKNDEIDEPSTSTQDDNADDDDEDKNADDKKDKKQGFRQRLGSIRKSKRKKEVVQKEVSTKNDEIDEPSTSTQGFRQRLGSIRKSKRKKEVVQKECRIENEKLLGNSDDSCNEEPKTKKAGKIRGIITKIGSKFTKKSSIEHGENSSSSKEEDSVKQGKMEKWKTHENLAVFRKKSAERSVESSTSDDDEFTPKKKYEHIYRKRMSIEKKNRDSKKRVVKDQKDRKESSADPSESDDKTDSEYDPSRKPKKETREGKKRVVKYQKDKKESSVDPSESDDKTDSEYDPSRKSKERSKERKSRNRKKDKPTNTPSSDTDEETEYEQVFHPISYLGERNNECTYCGALHLPGKHYCCSNGKVFIPPFPRLPPLLNSLYFDVQDRRGREFVRNILSYNTIFSFASIQYRKIKAAPFGPQVMKTQGAIRHFPSALFPKVAENTSFGNYYVFDHDEAVNKRMSNPYHGKMDRQIVSELTTCMTQHNPFAKMYKSMAQCIDEAKNKGHNPDHVRLKIIDAHGVNKKLLKEMHPGIYKAESHKNDFVSVFFDSSAEQNVRYPGLTIYPKRSNNPSRPIYPWMKQVSPLCYPLLFPRGEPGWKASRFPVAIDRTCPYKERLRAYAQFHPEEAALWDTPPEELMIQDTHLEGDPNLESSRDENDDNLAPNYYDESTRHNIVTEMENGENEQIYFVERNGDVYPNRAESTSNKNTSVFPAEREMDDDLHSNSSSSEVEIEEVNDNSSEVQHYTSTHEDSEVQVGEKEMLRGGENAEEPIPATNEPKHRKFASFCEYGLYIHQKRMLARNRISAARKLGQLFTIDMATRLHQFRSQAIREHYSEYLTSTKSKFLGAYQRKADKHGVTIGCVTSIPSTIPGSPRWLQEHFENGTTLVNKKGKPDAFWTFTTNVNWREIQDNLEPGTTWEDNPHLVNEVFWKKWKIFLEDVVGKPERPGSKRRSPGIFGEVAWYTFSIEFQQRGPPHAHLIVSFKKHIRTASEIDRICQAELPVVPDPSHPDYAKQLRLRELVERFMIHRPCENDPNAYCQTQKKSHWKQCKKRYPKTFNRFTKFDDRQYPELRRRDTGETCEKKSGNLTVIADNRHVIAHNLEMLSRHECHINVEIISNLRVLKYIFKYLFKGFDRVLVEAVTSTSTSMYPNQMTLDGHIFYPSSLNIPKGALAERKREAAARLKENKIAPLDKAGKPVAVYDETYMVEDMRAMTACEAAWDFMALPRAGCSHTIVPLFIHAPDDEPVTSNFGDEEQAKTFKKITEEEIHSRLKAWFELNKSSSFADRDAKSMTFDRIPEKYLFENGKWRLRKKDMSEHTLGRMKYVSPRHLETFAIRLLATSVPGVTSFEELRTVDDEIQETFADACRKRGLMNDEQEWHNALSEAAEYQMPLNLRRMFITILIFCAPKDPRELWEAHKEDFFERKQWSDEQKEAHALFHIESGLRAHGMSLKTLGLPDVDKSNLPHKVDLVDDLNAPTKTTNEYAKMGKSKESQLNEEQKAAFDTIVETIENDSSQPFFIEGSGGCGKTFLYKTLYYTLSGKGYKVLSVAHTGIASILLPNGATVHRTFSIPLITEDNMHSKVELESSLATDLKEVDVILWDECTMTDRRILQAVHQLFVNLHPEKSDVLFGGVSLIFGGDFRQTLPIVPGVKDASVLDYTILRSDLWNHIKVLHLYKNMRAVGHEEFILWLQKVGNGTANDDQSLPEYDQEVSLPQECLVKTEAQLIDDIFGGGKIGESIADSSTILTVDNKTSLEINNKILKLLPGDEKEFKSIDSYDENRGFKELDPECYNMLTPTGMPPHKLHVKVGSIVILQRNLNVSQGLCNGSRMKVLKIQPNVITCRPIHAQTRTPDTVFIHRILLTTTTAPTRELAFVRRQFPLRLAYSMTINKSQGQTFDKVGLLLRTPPFAHGQLFVAVSRVRNFENLRIYNSNKSDRQKTSNIVYREALI